MHTFWLNWVGFPLDEKRLNDVTHPRLEMLFHVSVEWVNRLTMAGLGMVGPFVAATTGQASTFNAMARVSFRCGGFGAASALVVAPARYIYLYHNKTNADMKKRCAAIRRMNIVTRSERSSLLGALSGYGAAVILKHPSKIPMPVYGLCAGMLIAQIHGVIVEMTEQKPETLTAQLQQHPVLNMAKQ